MLLCCEMCLIPTAAATKLASCCYVPSFLLNSHVYVTVCGKHLIISVRDIKIAEALLTLFFAYNVMKRFRYCWNWGIIASHIETWDTTFTSESFTFSITAGWIAVFMLFYTLVLLCNGQNIAKHKVYGKAFQ